VSDSRSRFRPDICTHCATSHLWHGPDTTSSPPRVQGSPSTLRRSPSPPLPRPCVPRRLEQSSSPTPPLPRPISTPDRRPRSTPPPVRADTLFRDLERARAVRVRAAWTRPRGCPQRSPRQACSLPTLSHPLPTHVHRVACPKGRVCGAIVVFHGNWLTTACRKHGHVLFRDSEHINTQIAYTAAPSRWTGLMVDTVPFLEVTSTGPGVIGSSLVPPTPLSCCSSSSSSPSFTSGPLDSFAS
jgi:hypothetical protein